MSVPIRFSPRELKNLAEMLSLAFAIADEGRENLSASSRQLTEWGSLLQKVMALAYLEPDLRKGIEYPDDDGGYSFTPSFEEKAFFTECLDNFRDNMFWGELVARMADKAVVEHLGQEAFDAMSEEECRKLTEPLEHALWEECTKRGIDRFGFVLPPEES